MKNYTNSEVMEMVCRNYEIVKESHLVEDQTGITDPEELNPLIAGIATAITINKIMEDKL